MKTHSILKIGHRGAKGYKAENTLDSFEKAIQLKVDGIELDVHLSLDNKIVVIHDETINRTTNSSGFVNQFTSKELKKFDIPELLDVIELVIQKCFINIELKGNDTASPVVAIISNIISNQSGNYSDFLISSFDWKMLETTCLLNPKIQIGVLTEQSVDKALVFAKKINAFSIHPNYRLLTKENVTLMQENGFEVYPWTVNSKKDIQKMKSLNVNGIITDFPDKI